MTWHPHTSDFPKRQKGVNELFGHCLIMKQFSYSYPIGQLYDKKKIGFRIHYNKELLFKAVFL